jgi:hypothetical protein
MAIISKSVTSIESLTSGLTEPANPVKSLNDDPDEPVPPVEPVDPNQRIFWGELPPAVTYLTSTAKPAFFYNGYLVTSDKEVIAMCNELQGIKDVTAEVDISKVPRPGLRTRTREWASSASTVMTPGELLARAVRVQSTADLGGNSEASNSTV